jgi:hypothetical protein
MLMSGAAEDGVARNGNNRTEELYEPGGEHPNLNVDTVVDDELFANIAAMERMIAATLDEQQPHANDWGRLNQRDLLEDTVDVTIQQNLLPDTNLFPAEQNHQNPQDVLAPHAATLGRHFPDRSQEERERNVEAGLRRYNIAPDPNTPPTPTDMIHNERAGKNRPSYLTYHKPGKVSKVRAILGDGPIL